MSSMAGRSLVTICLGAFRQAVALRQAVGTWWHIPLPPLIRKEYLHSCSDS
jgi:hypothetical protein